jgi:hypothetical protein
MRDHIDWQPCFCQPLLLSHFVPKNASLHIHQLEALTYRVYETRFIQFVIYFEKSGC